MKVEAKDIVLTRISKKAAKKKPASKGEAVITFNSDENMKDNGETVANVCTCVVVAGGGSAVNAVSSAKLAVTLTSPTAGKATFKQTDYTPTGIYGLVIQAKDVNNNEGKSGGVKVVPYVGGFPQISSF